MSANLSSTVQVIFSVLKLSAFKVVRCANDNNFTFRFQAVEEFYNIQLIKEPDIHY